MKHKILIGLTLLLGLIAFSNHKALAATTDPPLATNIYPNDRATTTGYPLYMTIGTGEFPVGTALAAIITKEPGTYTLKIEDAAFCNLDSYYSVRALDLPLSSRGSQAYFKTSFSVRDKNLQYKPGNGTLGFAHTETGYLRECDNRDRTFTFKVEGAKTEGPDSDWNSEVNGYRLIFVASNGFLPLNTGHYPTPPGAAENSFRLEVTGGPSNGNPRIYFSSKNVGGSNLNNVSSRNRPDTNYANYIAVLGIPCRLNPRDKYVEADLNFYDVDNGTYQNTSSPYQPPLQFKVQYKINPSSPDPTGVYDPRIPPPRADGWTDFPFLGDWVTIPGGNYNSPGTNDPQTVLSDFRFYAGLQYRVEVRGLTYRNAATYSLTSENVAPYFADEENCEPANEPVGFIDSCELLANGSTLIKGWAYDADANNNNRPNISLKLGNNDPVEASTNRNYFPGKVEAWLRDNGSYSDDAFDNVYGWEVTQTLSPGREYTISGTVNNAGDTGSDRSLRINGFNVQEDPPADKNVFPSNPNGTKRLPDRCVPELEVPVKCVGRVTADDNEAGKQTRINVTIKHGQSSDRQRITVRSVSFDQLPDMVLSGAITPTPPQTIEKNEDKTFSREVLFSRPKEYSLGATVRYEFNGSSEVLERRCDGSAVTYIKPYLKVFGGDIWAGGGFYGNRGSNASIYAFAGQSGGDFKGSSGQFGVTALRNIKNLYSASQVDSRQPKNSTFANTSLGSDSGNSRADSAYGGGFRPGGSNTGLAITDYYTETRDTTLGSSTFTSSSLSANAGRKQYVMGSTIGSNSTLPGDGSGGDLVIPRATQAAVYVIGDLYITKNVRYSPASRSSTNDIPFFAVIVKGNIFIDKGVNRLDGLFIAQPTDNEGTRKGKIFTCSSIGGGNVTLYALGSTTHDNECNQQLSVNGSFIARQLKFLRVNQTLHNAGTNESINFADGTGTGAGEVINFNPELYLAPSPLKNPDEQTGTPKYDAIFSLPPVF